MSLARLEQLLKEAFKLNDDITLNKDERKERFEKLIKAINKEAYYLPKADREAVLERVFQIRDYMGRT